jgi:hypothetical protein
VLSGDFFHADDEQIQHHEAYLIGEFVEIIFYKRLFIDVHTFSPGVG